jgi:hypothetical protein
MAIKALNPFAPYWYVPKDEQKSSEELKTRFRLRGLDGEQLGHVGPEFIMDEFGRVKNITGRGIEIALSFGVTDWENFNNDQGAVKFSRANFRLIPYDIRSELAVEIISASSPSEEERKN